MEVDSSQTPANYQDKQSFIYEGMSYIRVYQAYHILA